MWNKIFKTLLLCFLITNAYGETEDKKEYIVGIEETNYFPLYAVNEHREFIGVYREILDKFAKDNNIKFIYKPLKVQEIYKEFFSKNIDLKFPDHPSWKAADKRNYSITYSNRISHSIVGVFVLEENKDITLDKVKVLGQPSDAILWSIHHYIEVKKIRLKQDNISSLIEKLINREIEGIYYDYIAMNYELQKYKNKPIVFAHNLPFIDDYHYLSSLNHSELITKFNEWLEKNLSFVKESLNKYTK